MKNKNTKRALLISVLSLIVCIAVFVGTTFAWFTDSTSLLANKIQAGTLKVGLYAFDGTDWIDAEGKTLNFASEDILWEPGCTHSLQKIKITNEGNLALKYEIVVSGFNGDEELYEVIEWSVDGVAEGALLSGGHSEEVSIKGHMDKDAGNEYQGLSIESLTILVRAKQHTYEVDDNDDQYDADAEYPEP